MTGTATATTEVERLIEHRLREIEEKLRPMTELEAERRRLQGALGALRAQDEVVSSASVRSPASAFKRSVPRRAGRSKRAPRGANLTAIVEYVASHPEATAGEIAEATGITRGVVYSAASRLSSGGRLVRQPRNDGQVGYVVSPDA